MYSQTQIYQNSRLEFANYFIYNLLNQMCNYKFLII